MTELQMGLIGLGATAVVGVLAFNKWQEFRQRKLAEAVFQPRHEDVLLDGGGAAGPVAGPRAEPELRSEEPAFAGQRLEPMFADPLADAMRGDQVDDVEPPPAVQQAEPAPLRKAVRQSEPEPEPCPVAPPPSSAAPSEAGEVADLPVPLELLDPRLEFIVAMELVEPVSAEQVLHSQRAALRRLAKPVHWVAFNERTREWERLGPESSLSFRRLRIGLQLVNRLGPLSDGDLAIFSNAMQALADDLMAVAVMPSMRVLDQAAEIDRFCAAVDLEIGLNLISRGNAFPGTKIRALAEAAGMQLAGDGFFVRYDDDGRVQFTLHNYESTPFAPEALRAATTHGLTFVLDVPRVDHGERVFSQMIEILRRFADTLQGVLVDDNRQPLNDAQLEHIRREFIGKPQATMAGFGLAAGSPQALRLFS